MGYLCIHGRAPPGEIVLSTTDGEGVAVPASAGVPWTAVDHCLRVLGAYWTHATLTAPSAAICHRRSALPTSLLSATSLLPGVCQALRAMSLPVDVKHVCLFIAPVFSTFTVIQHLAHGAGFPVVFLGLLRCERSVNLRSPP
jgi:hypothetical protein